MKFPRDLRPLCLLAVSTFTATTVQAQEVSWALDSSGTVRLTCPAGQSCAVQGDSSITVLMGFDEDGQTITSNADDAEALVTISAGDEVISCDTDECTCQYVAALRSCPLSDAPVDETEPPETEAPTPLGVTNAPTASPSATVVDTLPPTEAPTEPPTPAPTVAITETPTNVPSTSPTVKATTASPTTAAPVTASPSMLPSVVPSSQPVVVTPVPTMAAPVMPPLATARPVDMSSTDAPSSSSSPTTAQIETTAPVFIPPDEEQLSGMAEFLSRNPRLFYTRALNASGYLTGELNEDTVPTTLLAPLDGAVRAVENELAYDFDKLLGDEGWTLHLQNLVEYTLYSPGQLFTNMSLTLGGYSQDFAQPSRLTMVNGESIGVVYNATTGWLALLDSSYDPARQRSIGGAYLLPSSAILAGNDILYFLENGDEVRFQADVPFNEVLDVPGMLVPKFVYTNVFDLPDSEYSIFLDLLRATTLDSLLTQTGNDDAFTILAPTNEAFRQLNLTMGDMLLDLSTNPNRVSQLFRWLGYHIIAQDVVPVDQFVDGGMYPTLNSREPPLTATVMGNTVRIEDAIIVDADLLVFNGIVQGIDMVLIPPSFLEPDQTPTPAPSPMASGAASSRAVGWTNLLVGLTSLWIVTMRRVL